MGAQAGAGEGRGEWVGVVGRGGAGVQGRMFVGRMRRLGGEGAGMGGGMQGQPSWGCV